MINVIIPMSGEALYETSGDFIYPKILTEVSNKTLLEYSQEIFGTLTESNKLIYVAPQDKLNKLGLASIIKTISNNEGHILPLQGSTKGAVCSCLMAIDILSSMEDELIISSADHYIHDDLQNIINTFRSLDADAGVLTFESVHPKWSFVKLNAEKNVVQAAEKNAISRTAIAGLYYFKKAGDFVEAAKNLIRKDAHFHDVFYLSGCLNELVLLGKKIKCRPLRDSVYHNFYDAHAVKSFELAQSSFTGNIKNSTLEYVRAFSERNLERVIDFFDKDAVLVEPGKTFTGRNEIETMLQGLFAENEKLSFFARNIIADGLKSTIEFNLSLNDVQLSGVDFIEWSSKGKIIKLSAYL